LPLHDPIPFGHVAELIGEAEPARQPAVLHDAWREYAAKAVRPYAWKTFAQYAREHFMESNDWSLERGKDKLTPWQAGARESADFRGAFDHLVLDFAPLFEVRVRTDASGPVGTGYAGGGVGFRNLNGERRSMRISTDGLTASRGPVA
jgi:hypothetical protein